VLKVRRSTTSLAAIIGKWLEPLTAPVGFNWQINVALIFRAWPRARVAVASLGNRLFIAIEGGKESRRADRPGAGQQVEPRPPAPRAARLVRVSRRSAPRRLR